jgi:hypothetical protein
MPKARGMAEADQAANLERRALELRHKMQLKEITEICKAHPHTIADVHRYLNGLGFSAADEGGTRAQKSLLAASASERRAKKTKAGEAPVEATPSLDQQYPAEALFPNDAVSVSQLKLSVLHSQILSKLEPGSLSGANLRSSQNQRGKDNQKQAALQIYALCTGKDPDEPITGQLRIWDVFHKLLMSLNIARGRPCQDIVFPMNLDKVGVYQAVCTEKSIVLTNRITKEQSEVSIDPAGGSISTDDLIITLNYSDHRAKLSSKSNRFEPYAISDIMAQSATSDPAVPKLTFFALPGPAKPMSLLDMAPSVPPGTGSSVPSTPPKVLLALANKAAGEDDGELPDDEEEDEASGDTQGGGKSNKKGDEDDESYDDHKEIPP